MKTPTSMLAPDDLLELVREEAHQGAAVDGAEALYADPEGWAAALETALAISDEHRRARARKLEVALAEPGADPDRLRRTHAGAEQGAERFESRLRQRLIIARRAAADAPAVRRRELLASLRAAAAGLVQTARPYTDDHPDAGVTLVQSRRLDQIAEVLTALDALDDDARPAAAALRTV